MIPEVKWLSEAVLVRGCTGTAYFMDAVGHLAADTGDSSAASGILCQEGSQEKRRGLWELLGNWKLFSKILPMLVAVSSDDVLEFPYQTATTTTNKDTTMASMAQKLDKAFIAKIHDTLENSRISEQQEDQLLELLNELETRSYTSVDYQAVLKIRLGR